MHKSCYVVGPLKKFRIRITINKIQKLIRNFLNIGNFIKIGDDQRMFGKEFLFLLFEPLFKFILDFVLFVLKFFLEVEETLVNVFHLLKLEAF